MGIIYKIVMRNCFYILVLLPLVVGCNHFQPSEKEEGKAVKVGVITIDARNVANAMSEYVGTVEGNASVDMSFGGVGRVATVVVKEGDRVRKGQLIATMDNNSAQSSYQAAKATLERAEDAYGRAKMVYEKGSLPEVKWIEVQTQLNQARALCDIAQKTLADCSLTAPMSASVAKRYVEPGATVSPLQPVVKLVDMTYLCVRVSVPESDISTINLGDTVRVSVNAVEGLQLCGVVDEKDISADAVSHSYLVRVRLIGTKEQMQSILPGMVCRVRMSEASMLGVDGDVQQDVSLIVPNRAVQMANNGERYVWKVTDGSRVERCVVTIGDLLPDGVLVTSGLATGDIVVVDGTQKIATGSAVSFEL